MTSSSILQQPIAQTSSLDTQSRREHFIYPLRIDKALVLSMLRPLLSLHIHSRILLNVVQKI